MRGADPSAARENPAETRARAATVALEIAARGRPFHSRTMKPLHLPIASPCHEDWDAMDPTARGRFCHKCEKQVLDVSTMTEREARSTLSSCRGTHVCVRYQHDDAGTIRFRPEPRVAAAAAGVVLTTLLAACAPHDNPDVRRDPPVVRVEPKPAPDPVRAVMGEAPAIEPVVMGAIAEIEPEPLHELKGDVAIVDEPCDKPPAPPVQTKMGKMKRID